MVAGRAANTSCSPAWRYRGALSSRMPCACMAGVVRRRTLRAALCPSAGGRGAAERQYFRMCRYHRCRTEVAVEATRKAPARYSPRPCRCRRWILFYLRLRCWRWRLYFVHLMHGSRQMLGGVATRTSVLNKHGKFSHLSSACGMHTWKAAEVVKCFINPP